MDSAITAWLGEIVEFGLFSREEVAALSDRIVEKESRGRLAALSQAQRSTLQTFYIASDPRPKIDLTTGKYPELMIGTIPFNCASEELFCGIIEVIYAMRNALLHGELQPDAQVLACYDPAYRIVMQFLDCIRG
jgi:hypothetical protein